MAVPGDDAQMATPGEIQKFEVMQNMRRCRTFEIKGVLITNPVVTLTSIVIIWGFVVACMVSPDYALKGMSIIAFDWIPEVFTWLYIISQDIWILVLIYILVVSKYGNLKLGRDDEEPEYSFATWFSMLFSAGVAVGLFYYSVAEPIWHYKAGSARWNAGAKGYGNDNEDSMHGLMITFYHWGLHGWIPYTTMGAVLAILHYRRNMPMSVRFCFYPLIGDRIYGILGDIIDTISILTTIMGVCTSLGLGAMQLNNGLQRLNHGFYRGDNFAIPADAKYSTPACGGTGQVCAPDKEPYGIQVNVDTQVVIIVVITCVATISVVSGLNRGIVNLSRVNFALGMFLALVVLFLGETYYILDTMVQTFGYYVWYVVKIGFQTDAFERLGSKDFGLGGAADGKGGGSGWLSGWTLFYWGWWISWGPFVGTFLARISRGRTLRQFILGTLFIPTLYSIFWFSVFGGEGIRMQRQADGAGICTAAYAADTSICTGLGGQKTSKCVAYSAQYNSDHKEKNAMGWSPNCVLDPEYHDGYGKCKEFKWTRHVEVGNECVESTSWVSVPCGANGDPTALASLPQKGPCKGVMKMEQFNHFKKENNPPCFKPAQDNIVCLYNQGTTDIFFDQLASYGPRGFTDLLCVLGLVALFLYFVTSSDSGSMVVDMISANGHPEPPIPLRIFWSFTEGATAIALLTAGKNLPNSEGSLKALQSASLVMGLPYTFILFWCAQSLYLLAKEESGEYKVDRKAFNIFILSFNKPLRLLINTLAPGVPMGAIVKQLGGWPFHQNSPKCAQIFWTFAFQSIFLLSIVAVICASVLYQWCIIGLALYFGFASLLGFLRASARSKFQIMHGDLLTDLICAFFLPMFTIAQIEEQLENEGKDINDAEKMIDRESL